MSGRTASGTTTVSRFGYDGDQVWADLSSSNALQTRYIRGDEVDQFFVRISPGNVAWYLTDWQGSVRNLTDGSGTLPDTIVYDGFGNITSESNTTFGGAYKYAGYRQDAATGQYETPARFYNGAVGRWDQQDPSGFTAGDENLYRYVANNAANATDPSGLEAQSRPGLRQPLRQ